MTAIKLLGGALVALIACTGVAADRAAAADEKTKMLPEAGLTFKSNQSGTNEMIGLAGSFVVDCTISKGSGTVESANLGKFKIEFEGCHIAGGTENCATVAAKKGLVTSEGVYHFWLARETLGGVLTLVGALVLLPTETHFTCVVLGLNQLIIFKGCDAALSTPLNTLTKVTKNKFAQSANGDQLITKVLPAGSVVEESCIFLASKNGSAFESAALVLTLEDGTFLSGAKEVTLLLMDPEAKE